MTIAYAANEGVLGLEWAYMAGKDCIAYWVVLYRAWRIRPKKIRT